MSEKKDSKKSDFQKYGYQPIKKGYQPIQEGYQPTQGSSNVPPPPKSGSDVKPPKKED